MDDHPAAAALEAFAAAIAAREWSALRAVLADDLAVTLLHTGERLDADGFVAFNRDYPGDWTYHRDDVLGAGERAVLRSHTVIGPETWHAASFATTGPDGRISVLTEIWSEAVSTPPDRSSR